MTQFKTEIRIVFGKEYLKIILADNSKIDDIITQLKKLNSVHKANKTSNTRDDITVYPVIDINITKQEVESFLVSYFDGILEAPAIKEALSVLKGSPAEDIFKKLWTHMPKDETTDMYWMR